MQKQITNPFPNPNPYPDANPNAKLASLAIFLNKLISWIEA